MTTPSVAVARAADLLETAGSSEKPALKTVVGR
jgi:hypothetical protein